MAAFDGVWSGVEDVLEDGRGLGLESLDGGAGEEAVEVGETRGDGGIFEESDELQAAEGEAGPEGGEIAVEFGVGAQEIGVRGCGL